MIKISIIMTEFVKSTFIEALESLKLDCEFTYYTYTQFADLPKIVESVLPSTDGIITSGFFPSKVIKYNFPDSPIIIREINIDDADAYYFLLRLLEEDRTLDIQRIYADFAEILGISLYDYIFGVHTSTLSDLNAEYFQSISFEELLNLESVVFKKHVEHWHQNKSDISVTRFSSLVPKLKAKGIPTYFPMPSVRYIKEVVEDTIQNIKMQQMVDSQTALITVSITDAHNLNLPEQNFDLKQGKLFEALVDYKTKFITNFILHKTHSGVEITTDRKTIEHITEHYINDDLGTYLRAELPFEFIIGYGLGESLYETRLNSFNAAKTAHSHGPYTAFLFESDNQIIGPLGNSKRLFLETIESDVLTHYAAASSLSTLTIQKILALANTAPERKLTARYVADHLSITIRSANRIIKCLLQTDLLQPIDLQKTFTKGRPSKIYLVKNLSEITEQGESTSPTLQ